jgi:hypothetical protein
MALSERRESKGLKRSRTRRPFEAALPGSAEAVRRQAWARLIRRTFEVDPMVCPRCKVEMEVVARITEPAARATG